MVATVATVAYLGLEARSVEVQVQLSTGIPAFIIVGLPDKAVAESRLPDDVREFLAGLGGVRVQFIRRHGGVAGPGVRVFTARLGAEPGVWTTVLADAAEVPTLDLSRPEPTLG